MTTTTTLQQQAKALGDPTRHAIFRRIADADGPLGVTELNDGLDLNHNAVRQHLAKLMDAGLVVEGRAAPSGRGRPRLVYALDPGVEGQWGTTGPYERLSRLLAEIIRTGHSPEQVGQDAAGRFQVPSPSGDAVADLTAAMARQGFDPEVRTVRGRTEIVLRTCAFAATAEVDRATVCAIHLGIAEGLTRGRGIRVDELVARDPHRADCRLRIAVDASPEAGPEGSARLTLRDGRAR